MVRGRGLKRRCTLEVAFHGAQDDLGVVTAGWSAVNGPMKVIFAAISTFIASSAACA